jgi:hypothetical protein
LFLSFLPSFSSLFFFLSFFFFHYLFLPFFNSFLPSLLHSFFLSFVHSFLVCLPFLRPPYSFSSFLPSYILFLSPFLLPPLHPSVLNITKYHTYILALISLF